MTGSGMSLTSVGVVSGGGDSDESSGMDSQVLIQQLHDVKEERERISNKYDQVRIRA